MSNCATSHLPRTGTLEERFWARVDRNGEGGCWVWQGGRKHFGHGLVSLGRARKKGESELLAHRYSWELANGPVPPGMCVMHKCDHPPCVNPAHLELGTRGDNAKDMYRKGRGPNRHGERHPLARLTEHDVIDIRTLTAFGASAEDLAVAFTIKPAHVKQILRRDRWRHVP